MTRYNIIRQTLNNAETFNKINIQLSKSIKMTDNSMEALISKGAVWHFEEVAKIENSDVVVTTFDESYVVKKEFKLRIKLHS